MVIGVMGRRMDRGIAAARGMIWGAASCLRRMAAAALIGGALMAAPASAAGTPADGAGLVDQLGHPVTTQSFAGKPSLVFFGFANCPSICPTALAEIADRMADLGPLADRLNVIFISADPERDTPEVLKDYLASFDARIVGVTGSLAEIGAIAKAVGAEFHKVPLAGGGYTIDHSGNAFLLDRNWKRTGLLIIGQGADPARATAKLKTLIGE
ncbi:MULTISPECIES: SCO family protein [Rhodomicrobium]|uniref:SCO family protein n=1 Tax=Rhodomicrobium TaxID=1068 RepID=UPI0014836E59|nr:MULTISPECIES: SCO family protein [Rhodomicrobium]